MPQQQQQQQQKQMKIVVLPVLLALLFVNGVARISQANAQRYIIKVVLNNGTMPTVNGDFCNDEELIKIDDIIRGYSINNNNNNNNDNDNDNDNGDSEDSEDEDDRRQLQPQHRTNTGHRGLATYSRKCADYCRFYKTGTCRASQCLGYRRDVVRRQLQKLRRNVNNNNKKSTQRRLSICDDNIDRVTQGLRDIESQVSASCMKVLQCEKSITCFDEVQYARIDSFTMWNTETNQIVREQVNDGDSFCYTTQRLNIEAIPNACVEQVRFRLTGTNGFNEKTNKIEEGPYSVFGSDENSHGNYDRLNGRRLPIGTYTLTTELMKSATPTSRLQFTIKKC